MAKLKSTAKAKAPRTAGPRSAPKASEGLSRSIMDSAQQIWMAGMGAFNRAQAEGTKMFEALVSEGMTLEKRTRNIASGRVDAVRDAVESRVGQVKERANDTWDRLEKVFEDRVQGSLVRLGVPSRDDLQALIARVDRLNAELRKLSAKPAPSRSAAAKPATRAARPRKAAVKAATPRTARKAPATRRSNAARSAPIQDATE
jgi:poly(hydroxyalkanoate) granule-associated protein